jgi:predicted AlkP superfamily pyrophosphatase or phosphodiesterase
MKLVSDLDGLVGFLINLLKEYNLFDEMNLIITSDHGMADITDRVYLEDHIDFSTFKWYGSSPVIHIWPNDGKIFPQNCSTQLLKLLTSGQADAIYEGLKDVKRMNVYHKEEIPSEYRYTFNERIPPLLLVADPGISFCPFRANCSEISECPYVFHSLIEPER